MTDEQQVPERAEFSEFVVRRVKIPSVEVPWYEVHIKDTLKHLFRVATNVEPTDQPGWLGDVRFPTYEDAVAFGWSIAPTIREAQRLRGEASSKIDSIITAINNEHSRRRAERNP